MFAAMWQARDRGVGGVGARRMGAHPVPRWSRSPAHGALPSCPSSIAGRPGLSSSPQPL